MAAHIFHFVFVLSVHLSISEETWISSTKRREEKQDRQSRTRKTRWANGWSDFSLPIGSSNDFLDLQRTASVSTHVKVLFSRSRRSRWQSWHQVTVLKRIPRIFNRWNEKHLSNIGMNRTRHWTGFKAFVVGKSCFNGRKIRWPLPSLWWPPMPSCQTPTHSPLLRKRSV